MAVSQTRITGPVVLPDGSAATTGQVVFTLRAWDKQGDALVMHGPVMAPITDGAIDVTLFRTGAGEAGTPYDVSYVWWDDLGELRGLSVGPIALSGAGPFSLAELLATSYVPSTQPDALAQALAAAVAAASEAATAGSAREAAALAAAQAALYEGVWLDDVAAIEADTTLTYAAGSAQVAVGNFLRTRDEQFGFLVAEVEAEDADMQTAGQVKAYARARDRSDFNVFQFGVKGDGVTDDAAALNRAIARTQALGGRLIVPPGLYRYGSELQISDVMQLQGAGLRRTIFQPMDDYSGWFMGITETTFAGSVNQGPAPTLGKDLAGVGLADFSVRSSRSGVVQHGIRCIGRNDRMQWNNIYVELLEGTHYHFGHENGTNSEGNPAAAYIREGLFRNVESRGGGQAAGAFPAVVFDSHGVGDASNLCDFFGFRVVYPYHVGCDFDHAATQNAIRRLAFYSALFHASDEAPVAHTSPMLRLTGRLNDLAFYGFKTNTLLAGQPGVEMNGKTVAGTLYRPDGILLDGGISSGAGDLLVLNNCAAVEANFRQLGSSGTHLTIGANVAGPVQWRCPKVATFAIADGQGKVLSSYRALQDETPARFSRIVLGEGIYSPLIMAGSVLPEAAIAAPAPSMYFYQDQDGERDSDTLYLKGAGSDATGWWPVSLLVGGDRDTQLPETPTLYQWFFDNPSKASGRYDGSGWWWSPVWKNVPASATATGIKDQIARDDDYFYVCTGTNVWKRAALSSW
ncbi:glycoside hydrolase family 55 protein [Pseudooceanicola sp. CBS1P-1]|uniref:Rhamnogalacturonase A/B/Epimerase-like pectate lyase domain-containing protein n=1 Tax=Pseudooceanicola albus TaxID=2692189 RepID=A0A6L7GCX0_9RHOB|nr:MULTISPECIES: glycosyl hydrolase family 28-related protein [Pseudooceanicola]MBT9387013.1 glycoside hydrolase family 55 protein [Pseudooceanicola endophyticus]MXN21146.1 hypothetical protein [Pseudooceanicola albus]